ncbi:hypothetical protein C8J56DRAFT_881567 [Mycena floridula]|nr:hypothetical protein C8J56DRAFT_881567 [Mycena floridula]
MNFDQQPAAGSSTAKTQLFEMTTKIGGATRIAVQDPVRVRVQVRANADGITATTVAIKYHGHDPICFSEFGEYRFKGSAAPGTFLHVSDILDDEVLSPPVFIDKGARATASLDQTRTMMPAPPVTLRHRASLPAIRDIPSRDTLGRIPFQDYIPSSRSESNLALPKPCPPKTINQPVGLLQKLAPFLATKSKGKRARDEENDGPGTEAGDAKRRIISWNGRARRRMNRV